MESAIFIHEIKLSETDEFSRKFNDISDSYAKSNDTSLPKEQRDKHFEDFFQKKLCLELGL